MARSIIGRRYCTCGGRLLATTAGPKFAQADFRFDHTLAVCARRFHGYVYVDRDRGCRWIGFLAQGMMFEGDPGVRKVADDPVLSAELLLLFRMILADGMVKDSEMEMFRRICRDAFGIEDESFDGVVEYLNDFGYETSGAQAIEVFRELDPERRRLLARHMAEIAKADAPACRERGPAVAAHARTSEHQCRRSR